MDEKNSIKTPEETAQALDRMADRLEEMDKAEGVFGEPVDEDLPDEYLEEISGGTVGFTVTAWRSRRPGGKYRT